MLHEPSAAGHVQLLAVERHEQQVLARTVPVGLHRAEHAGEGQQRGHARRIVVRTRVDSVPQPAQMIVVRPDDQIFVRGCRGGEQPHHIADGDGIFVAETLGVSPVDGLEPQRTELFDEVVLSQLLAMSARSPALGHFVCQVCENPALLFRRNQVLIGPEALRPGPVPARKAQKETRKEQNGTTFSHLVSNDMQK